MPSTTPSTTGTPGSWRRRGRWGRSVAVAMSCGLTQRGALPLLPESVRVRAALECGADLVFALPAPWACAGAEAFARAGVHLLAATGCDALVFGAETPDAALLLETARVLNSAAYRAALKQQLAAGARSFAAARQAAVQAVGADPAMAALLSQPNNNLAVEYCRAILEQRAGMTLVPLPRRGQPRADAGGERPRAICQCQRSAGSLGRGRSRGRGPVCAGKGV